MTSYTDETAKMIGLLLSIFLLGAAAEKVCYPDLGCFNNLPPFLDIPDRPVSPLPDSREDVGTEFVLNTPSNGFDFEYDIISNLQPDSLANSNFNPDLETKILVHGYGESGYSSWIETMGRAFLSVGNYNIIRVDWFPGAFELYHKATSNARLVGAEISLLMDNIKALYPNTLAASASNYHIVGYSLGAHVAGYAGERQPGLARITGLDPSKPYFENTATQVRLDPTDATFVDAYHTDVSPLLQRGYGMYQPVGHVDFYPNAGTDQPGCDSSVTESLPLNSGGVYDGGIVFVACNHKRAHEIFIETIYHYGTSDQLLAFPTDERNMTDYFRLYETLPPGIEMGINAVLDPATPENTWYQRATRPTTAYGNQYKVTVSFADPNIFADTAVGILYLTINGNEASIRRVQLGGTEHYEPGSTHTFYIFTDDYPGYINNLGFYWEYDRDWYKPWTWIVFSNPDVYVHRIYLTLLEDSQSRTFCGDGDKYKSNQDDDRTVYSC